LLFPRAGAEAFLPFGPDFTWPGGALGAFELAARGFG
jgi:hypothetical protein